MLALFRIVELNSGKIMIDEYVSYDALMPTIII